MKKTTYVTCPRCLTDQNPGPDPFSSLCSTCGHTWSHPAAQAPAVAEPTPAPDPEAAASTPREPNHTGATHICTRCGTIGWPRSPYHGSVTALGLVLLGLFALVGGLMLRPPSALVGMALLCTGVLVSSIEANRRSGPLCRTCETGSLVPLTTPTGRQMAAENDPETTR